MNDQYDNDVVEICGDVKKIKVHGIIYKVSPSPLKELPELQKILSKFQKIGDNEMLTDTTRALMARIMYMGLKQEHPEMTEEKIQETFSISVFPKILRIMLDLNDFLSGMGEIGTVTSQLLVLSQQRSGESKTNMFPKAHSKNLAKKN